VTFAKIHWRSRTFLRLLSAAVVLFLCSGTTYGAGDDFFLRQHIDISGTILGTREADFNGDGLIDVILLVSDPSGQRVLKSYIQRESGRFPPSSGQSFNLSTSANMVQCLDLDSDGRTELYVVDNNGLWRYDHNGEEFDERANALITMPTLFAAGIAKGLLSQDCIHTISGRPVAFIPVAGGYSLWEYNQESFRNFSDLRFSHWLSFSDRPVKLFSSRSHNRQERFMVSIPAIVISDSNGDDRDDIYLVWSDHLNIFSQNEQGVFEAGDIHTFRFQDPAEGNLCQSRLIDYDRDGRYDVVCCKSMGGISGAQTDINFYHSTQIRRRDRAESHHLSLTDACGNLIIGDFNNNGGPELVVPAVELGIMSMVKKMITKKTDFHMLIYPIDNLGRPAREPTVRKKISCRLDFESADPTANIRINWSGDYDGDGLKDLAVADGGEQLLFYRGNAENYLENKTDLELDIPNPDEIRTVHLNNDGRSDLIVIHKEVNGATRVTLLVTNRIG
jgi:hypothetical protein